MSWAKETRISRSLGVSPGWVLGRVEENGPHSFQKGI